MSERTRRLLEIAIGPLVPSLLLLPPMLVALVGLGSVAAEGRTGPGLVPVMIILVFGTLGTIALWVAVLRDRRILATSRPWRRVTMLGLALGMVAVAGGLPGVMVYCSAGWACAVPAILLAGPVTVGALHLVRLVSYERAGSDPAGTMS